MYLAQQSQCVTPSCQPGLHSGMATSHLHSWGDSQHSQNSSSCHRLFIDRGSSRMNRAAKSNLYCRWWVWTRSSSNSLKVLGCQKPLCSSWHKFPPLAHQEASLGSQWSLQLCTDAVPRKISLFHTWFHSFSELHQVSSITILDIAHSPSTKSQSHFFKILQRGFYSQFWVFYCLYKKLRQMDYFVRVKEVLKERRWCIVECQCWNPPVQREDKKTWLHYFFGIIGK